MKHLLRWSRQHLHGSAFAEACDGLREGAFEAISGSLMRTFLHDHSLKDGHRVHAEDGDEAMRLRCLITMVHDEGASLWCLLVGPGGTETCGDLPG